MSMAVVRKSGKDEGLDLRQRMRNVVSSNEELRSRSAAKLVYRCSHVIQEGAVEIQARAATRRCEAMNEEESGVACCSCKKVEVCNPG
jgi:hypothetical protein